MKTRRAGAWTGSAPAAVPGCGGCQDAARPADARTHGDRRTRLFPGSHRDGPHRARDGLLRGRRARGGNGQRAAKETRSRPPSPATRLTRPPARGRAAGSSAAPGLRPSRPARCTHDPGLTLETDPRKPRRGPASQSHRRRRSRGRRGPRTPGATSGSLRAPEPACGLLPGARPDAGVPPTRATSRAPPSAGAARAVPGAAAPPRCASAGPRPPAPPPAPAGASLGSAGPFCGQTPAGGGGTRPHPWQGPRSMAEPRPA